MPTMKNRKGGVGTKSQVGKPTSGQPSNGVQKQDGTENTNAGTKHAAVPWNLDGPSRVIKTHGQAVADAELVVVVESGVRHVIVGASHRCTWYNLDVNCSLCQCHALLTVCTCIEEVPCPDCGHRNALPEVTFDAN